MDVEKLANFRNKVMNLSDSSPVTEWKAIGQAFGDLYKEEVAEKLSGGALTTERGNMDTDIASYIGEMDIDTSAVLKPS